MGKNFLSRWAPALVVVLLLGGCGGGGGGEDPVDPSSVPPPTIIILTLQDGTVGIPYSVTLVAILGFPPFTWSVTGGALPDGLSLDSATGEVSGTPTTPGTFNLTIKVTDSLNNMDSQDYTVRIGAAIPVVEIISVDSNEVLGNSVSGTPAVSGSGRFVAFTSFATNLVASDTNIVPDVFLRDRVCTDTIRVSVASGGSEGGSQSFAPAISSAVGGVVFVAYASDANNLVANDTNSARDIFLTAVDVTSCPPAVITTARASVANDGSEATGTSQLPWISPDGRFVIYHSLASNLVEADSNNVFDIFVTEVDFSGGVLTPLSTRRESTNKVRLAIGIANTIADIFSNNTIGDSTLSMTTDEHVGREVEIVLGTGAGQRGLITANSATTFTVTPDWTTVPDSTSEFRVVTLEDLTSDAGLADVTTIGNASLTLTDNEHANRLRVVEIVGGTGQGQARLITANDATTFTVSPDWATLPDGTSLFRVLQQSPANAERGRLSGDAASVFFNSLSQFDSEDTNARVDVFFHDPVTAISRRESVNDAGELADGTSLLADVDGDGDLVLFQSDSTNLVANDTNGVNDLFLRDLSSAQTVRVSLANDGSESNGGTGTPDPGGFGGLPSPTAGLSGGGRLVAFTSAGTNLVADDRNLLRDIFLRDRQAATTTRLSLGLDAINPNGDSFDPDISLDGTTVAFASEASNLVVNDTNDEADIFAVCSDGTLSASCSGISDPPVIVVSRLPNPQVGALYSGTLLAVGGSEPYFWTLQEGALPPGLSLNPLSGRISGVPQQTGQFQFTVLVLDSGRPMRRSQRTFTLVVR